MPFVIVFVLIKTPLIVSSDDDEVEGGHGVKSGEGVLLKSRTTFSASPPAQPRFPGEQTIRLHYSDVIMDTMTSQITSLTIFYSTVYSGADQRKHQSPASMAFVRGIRRWPANSPHKGSATRKIFPFDDAIMWNTNDWCIIYHLCNMMVPWQSRTIHSKNTVHHPCLVVKWYV